MLLIILIGIGRAATITVRKSSTVLHDDTSTLTSVSANLFSVLPIRVASTLSLFLKSHLDEIDDVLLSPLL